MKVRKEWTEEQEVFDIVAGALQDDNLGIGYRVAAHDEVGPYGDRGYITITIDGRKFALDLHEIL